MEKTPKKKIIFGSIGICLIIVVLTIVIMPIGSVDGLMIRWPVLVLLGIEIARHQLAQKYNISFGKFLLLTMLPSVLVYGVYICFYVYMENNYWAELEGMLGYMIMLFWGGCICVSTGGTLLIALIRWLVHVLRRKKEEDVE